MFSFTLPLGDLSRDAFNIENGEFWQKFLPPHLPSPWKFFFRVTMSDSSFSSNSPLLYKWRLLTSQVNLIKLLQVTITTPRTVTSPLQLTNSNSYYTKDHQTTKKNYWDESTLLTKLLLWSILKVIFRSVRSFKFRFFFFFFIKWVKVCLPCQQRPLVLPLRWLNTVLRAVSGNLRDGACFKLDRQTWRRKSNGTQKTISQNLLIRILWYLAEFFLLSYFK